MKSVAVILAAVALLATAVRADHHHEAEDIDYALELGGACSGDWSGVYLQDVRSFVLAKDAALRAAQYLLDIKPEALVCNPDDDNRDDDDLDERFDDVDFRYVCQKTVSTGTYYKLSFSIDCDDDNGDENDDQALYLEAQFFKPKSGPIEFLNVTTAEPLDCSDVDDSSLVCHFGKYTLSCDTFWSGTNTANLACNLYDKSGSRQSLKLSCDISKTTTVSDLTTCLTSSSDWSKLPSTAQDTITSLLEKFKTAVDSGALATMAYNDRK